MSTNISWVRNPDGTPGEVWNPVTGCSPAGVGCVNCYARTLHMKRHEAYWRDKDMPHQYRQPFDVIQLHEDRLDMPLHWKKPRMIFVDSMSDLFHKDVTDEFLYQVFAILGECPRHTFVILTKRIQRPASYGAVFPSNVWLGVSCSTQAEVDRDVPILLGIPAAKHIVSLEPLVEGVDVTPYLPTGGFPCGLLDWVIAGSESINGRPGRYSHIERFRSLKDQCVRASVPFFCKQAEINGKLVHIPQLDGQVWDQIPPREVTP